MWESLIIVSVILVYFFTRNQKKESEEEIEEETQIEEETEKEVKEETLEEKWAKQDARKRAIWKSLGVTGRITLGNEVIA